MIFLNLIFNIYQFKKIIMNRFIFKKFSSKNTFSTQCYKQLKVNNESYNYYSINSLGSSVGIKNIYLDKLPYSIKILLESALRNCDDFSVKSILQFY